MHIFHKDINVWKTKKINDYKYVNDKQTQSNQSQKEEEDLFIVKTL